MVDYSVPPSPLSPRPSVSSQVKTAATGPVGTLVALVTAVGGLLTAWQTYQESQQTARASYETLATASQQNTIAIEACRQSQLELRSWVVELSSRSEQRTGSIEKQVARKVTKATAPAAAPAIPVGPAPTAPPVPTPAAPPALPAFDKLSQKAS